MTTLCLLSAKIKLWGIRIICSCRSNLTGRGCTIQNPGIKLNHKIGNKNFYYLLHHENSKLKFI